MTVARAFDWVLLSQYSWWGMELLVSVNIFSGFEKPDALISVETLLWLQIVTM